MIPFLGSERGRRIDSALVTFLGLERGKRVDGFLVPFREENLYTKPTVMVTSPCHDFEEPSAKTADLRVKTNHFF